LTAAFAQDLLPLDAACDPAPPLSLGVKWMLSKKTGDNSLFAAETIATENDMSQPRPNFLIAGAAKSGTTSLHEYLGQHPQIFMSANKEPHYFVRGYGIEKWDDYLSLFKNAGSKKAVGESSTGYLFCEESPEWIKSTLGQIKIILLLRNPAKRAFSLYGWMAREGYEDAGTFEEALNRESLRAQVPAFREQCPQFYPDYLYFTTGLYFEQVSRYVETFGRDWVKIYLFEDFIRQPVAICRNACEFLEVNSGFTPKLEVHNEGRFPASIAFQYWLRTKARRRLGFIPAKIRRKLIQALMGQNISRGGKLQPDQKLLDTLMARYLENIGKLEKYLDRDLSVWTSVAAKC
jgi:hypothetical protein